MPCPLCGSLLEVYEYDYHKAYECTYPPCLNDDMPRYKMTFENGKMITRTIMLGDHHIAFDYKNEVTIISKLISCFLTDSIRINRILYFDPDDPFAIIPKIRTLLLFT